MSDINHLAKIGVFSLNGVPVFVTSGTEVAARRVYGATFMPERFVWIFPAFRPFLEDVLYDFKVAMSDVPLTEKAEEHIQKQLAIKGVRPDFEFKTDPFDHQKMGTDFLICNLRAALFFDCGLGKTKIVIDTLRHEGGKTLVLAPATALRVWLREIEKHAGGELTALLLKPGSKKNRLLTLEAASDYDVLLLSYDSTHKYFELDPATNRHTNLIAAHFNYKHIIADESHYLGGSKSKRTQASLLLADRAVRRVIVSGTPTLGNPLHLFGQLSFLGRFLPGKNFYQFQKRFVIRRPLPRRTNIQAVYGYKNLDILNAKLQRVAMRKEADKCLDLPKRTIIDVEFHVTPEQKRTYNDLVKGYVTEISGETVISPEHAITKVSKLLQVLSGFYIHPLPNICDGCEYLKECVDRGFRPYTKACQVQPKALAPRVTHFKKHGKLDALTDLLRTLLADETHKVIIWCHFKEELNTVADLLKNQGYQYFRVDGSNSSDAEELSAEFENEIYPRVWLAQVSTGVSLTLNRAAYMIYYGIDFSLGHYLQSMDRNHRIGQERPTFIYRMTHEKSLLETVWAALEAKVNLEETLITRIQCVMCPNVIICLSRGLEPFDKDCVFSSRAKRVLARPRLLS